VTVTSIVAQHFNARDGENPADQGYGAWLNRLNVALGYGRFTLGMRLDSSAYWSRPIDTEDNPSQQLLVDETSRYRNALYPSKVWGSYAAPGLEVTIGDSYVQFGRGLTLSMRKIDELGVDTTLRGGKIAWQSDPFAATIVAGVANPSRVDEATGRALFLPLAPPIGTLGAQPLFGSDRIIGAEIQAGRGLPVALTTHAVRFTRCAPYRYDADGHIVDNGIIDPGLGSCDPGDTARWLGTLGSNTNPTLNASEVSMVGQGFEIPNIAGHAKLYIEGAIQKRYHDAHPDDPLAMGNALYGSASADFGPVTETLEIKSYRNFYAVAGGVDVNRAAEFNNVVYTTPPATA
jgi:hypothetical protein